MKRIKIIIFLFLGFLSTSSIKAAEFPWFNVFGLEGWAEISDNTSTDKRINVLPQIYGPTGVGYFGRPNVDTSNLIAVKSDRSIVLRYLILSDPSVLPKDFKKQVYDQIKGNGYPIEKYSSNNLDNYQVNFVRASDILLSLIVNGNAVQTKKFNKGLVSNRFNGEFYINYEADYYNDIREGNFKIEMSFTFPYTNYSGLTINLNQNEITKIKVESFKQVIQQHSSSGGSFLIFNWRKKVVDNIERERISSNMTSQYTSNIDIVMRDPDKTTLSLLDNLLGVAKLNQNEFIQKHKNLVVLAISQNNPKLGELSKQYVLAIENNDDSKQLEILKSLIALKDGDIATFIASGIRVSESSISTNSTYYGIFEANISSTNIDNYTSRIIKTIDYNYTLSIEDFYLISVLISEAERNAMIDFFQVSYPTVDIINSKLITSVTMNNISATKLCLSYGGNPNIEADIHGTHLLSIAIEKGNIEMLKLLLHNGANPNFKNINGETPLIVASNLGQHNIIQLLNEYKNRIGEISFEIQKPPYIKLDNFNFYIDNIKTTIELPTQQSELIKSLEIPLYPNKYKTALSANASIFINKNQWNNDTHYRLTNNRFAFKATPDGFLYFKTIVLYDNIKVINTVSNQYNYKILFDQINYNIIEEKDKHIYPYSIKNIE